MDRDRKGLWLQISGRRISFFWLLFISLFIITFISSSMQLILYNNGIDRSLNRWEENRLKILHDIGIDYLKHGIEPEFPEPVSIYNSDKILLISNRKNRRMMMKERLLPIKERNGKILGYISTKNIPFKSNIENRELLESILNNILLSTLVSMIISILLSLIISSKISKSAKGIKEAMGRIKIGEELTFTPSGPRELVEIGEGIKKLVSKLNSEEQIRNQWIHDISHDLKTPVTALKIQFESMIHGNLDISKERIVKNTREIERLEELILSINELMVMESPDLKPDLDEISVGDFLNDLKEVFFGRTELIIETSCSRFYGDYNLLLKAISNIVDNGIKYSTGGNWVKIAVERDKIIISNPGAPISPEEKKNMFNRLYRGDLSRNSSGSGIGLSIAKAIIQKHSMDISVNSTEGVNSFIIARV